MALTNSEHLYRLCGIKKAKVRDAPYDIQFSRLRQLAVALYALPVAGVSLLDSQRDRFILGPADDLFASQAGQSFLRQVTDGSEVLVVPDARLDDRFRENPLVTSQGGIRFFVGHPLMAPDGTTVGGLCLADFEPRSFGPDQLKSLQSLAGLAETEFWVRSLSRRRDELLGALKVLSQVAWVDTLTSLWSRAAILEIIRSELSRAARNSEPTGLLLLDLDRFKSVNDTYGHLAGDRVLEEVSRRFENAVRPYDSIGRYGGEEFVVLLPGVSSPGVRQVGERIRREVCSTPFNVGDDIELPVTVSIGAYAFLTEPEDTLESLLDIADQALYQAKGAGRNCVVVAEGSHRSQD